MEKPLQTQTCAYILGVDVSKDSLDVCLISMHSQQALNQKFNNNKEGFKRLKAWCKQQGCEAGLLLRGGSL